MNKLIVLIDDDTATNIIHERLIHNLTKEANLKVIETGRAAIDYFISAEYKNCNYDNVLLLLDFHLPGYDGLEIIDECWENDDDFVNKMEVHLLTNDFSLRLDEKSESYKIVKNVLRKPLEKDTLEQILNDFISESSSF
jgi:response regulator of citrate/malate metabolism